MEGTWKAHGSHIACRTLDCGKFKAWPSLTSLKTLVIIPTGNFHSGPAFSAIERCLVQACFIAATYWSLPSGLQTSGMLGFPGITGGPVVNSPCQSTLSSILSQEFLIPGDGVSPIWWRYVDGNKGHQMENERLPFSQELQFSSTLFVAHHLHCDPLSALRQEQPSDDDDVTQSFLL